MEEIRLRPVAGGDRDFLIALYGSTREHELAALPWTDEEKAAFVLHQFEAQDTHYRAHYAGATLDVVVVDGEDAGRLYVHRGPTDIRVMDIALAPGYRGRGIGERLLRELREEAGASGRRLSIHVEEENPARRLYERIGMRVVDAPRPPYLLMEWSAAA